MKTAADTCRTYIVPKLHTAGWDDEYITEEMVLTRGRIVLYFNSVQARLAVAPIVSGKSFKGEI